MYDARIWDKVCASGDGSRDESTELLQGPLRAFFTSRDLHSVVDIGCGVGTWMSRSLPEAVTSYVGYDVVPAVVSENTNRKTPIGWTYKVLDITCEVPSAADVAFARDVLVHLTFDKGLQALRNLKQAPIRWLFATTFPGIDVNTNVKQSGGWWRKLNLEAAPYLLPAPEHLFREKDEGKFLGVFDLGRWNQS